MYGRSVEDKIKHMYDRAKLFRDRVDYLLHTAVQVGFREFGERLEAGSCDHYGAESV